MNQQYTLVDVTQCNTTTTTTIRITINSIPVNCKNLVCISVYVCRPVTMKNEIPKYLQSKFSPMKILLISVPYWPIFDAIYFDIYTITLFVAVILFFVCVFLLLLFLCVWQRVQTDRRTFIFSWSRLANICMHMRVR